MHSLVWLYLEILPLLAKLRDRQELFLSHSNGGLPTESLTLGACRKALASARRGVKSRPMPQNPLRVILLAGLFAAVAVPPSSAQVTYTYTGNHFAFFQDGEPPSGSYTTAMSVFGFFVVANAFTPFVGYNFTPLAYEFTDGRTVFNSSGSPAGSAYFEIVTDASGQIDWWNIQLRDEPTPGNIRQIFAASTAPLTGQDSGVFQVSLNDVPGFDTGWVNSLPGSWTVSAAPEPGSGALLLAALGLLGGTARRRP